MYVYHRVNIVIFQTSNHQKLLGWFDPGDLVKNTPLPNSNVFRCVSQFISDESSHNDYPQLFEYDYPQLYPQFRCVSLYGISPVIWLVWYAIHMQMIHGSATYATLQLANEMFKWASQPKPRNQHKKTHTEVIFGYRGWVPPWGNPLYPLVIGASPA